MPNKKLKTQNSKVKSSSAKVKAKSKVQVKSSKTEKRVEVTLKIDVLDVKGKAAGSITLPKEVFGVKINPSIMAQAVRVYLANQRQGTASTKTRGEVRGSTRKIWKQKGTGRARHGGIRAPIFVKGGIAFGPKPRDFSLLMSKKMRKAALLSALSSKAVDNAIKILTGFEKIQPKTKEMVNVFKNVGVLPEKKVLLVVPSYLENVWKSARNIEGVRVSEARQLHAYDVLDCNTLICMQDAIGVLEKTFLTK